MAYKIESKPPSNIVTLTYSGKVDLDMRLRTVEEICSNYSDLKPLRVLVDVRDLEMDMLFGEQEAFGEYLANHYGLRHAKTAVLHNPGFNPNAVIDNCAYNNGFQMAEFSSHREAEQWLLAPEPD
jgi:hypothetical protein